MYIFINIRFMAISNIKSKDSLRWHFEDILKDERSRKVLERLTKK